MRSRARTSDLTLLVGGVLLVVGAASLAALVNPLPSGPRLDGSSHASHAGGAKAAYLMLRDIGLDVQRSYDPFSSLRVDAPGTAIVLAAPRRPPSGTDRETLAMFLQNGGTLLAAGSSAIGFLPHLTAGTEREVTGGTPAVHDAIIPSPLTRGAPTIRMPRGTRVVADRDVWMPLYGPMDDPAVLVARRGHGRVIWWASAHPLSNAGIAEAGSLELLLNAVTAPSRRRILWDEHYLGHDRSLWSYARHTPIPWGLLQLALVAAALLFTAGRRVGPVRPRPVDPRTSPLEFVETVGALYHRAHPAAAAVSVARARLLRLLRQRSGLPPTAADDRVVAAAERAGLDPTELRALLAATAAAARDPQIRDGHARELVGRLQEVAARTSQTQPPRAGRTPQPEARREPRSYR